MFCVLNPGESLTAVLSGAAATTAPTYSVMYDESITGHVNQPVGSLSNTAATIVATPTEGQRCVKRFQAYNGDTAAATVTLTKVTSATSVKMAVVTLGVGATLIVDVNGIRVLDTSGNLLQSISATNPSGSGSTAVSSAVATETGAGAVHTTVLTFTNTAVALTDEAGVVAYAGTKVYDFPEGAILFLGATTNLALTKSSAGVNVDWDGDVSLGTITASNNATLSSTEQNLIPTTSTPQAVAGVSSAKSQSTATESGVIFNGTGTAIDVYLNLLVDDADQDVTGTACNLILNGTITIVWANLGDY